MEIAGNQAERSEQLLPQEQEKGYALPRQARNGGARIVVVGGGVAGLEVATAFGKLKSTCVDTVTLVDSDSAHVWKPMLHTIAAGTRDLAQQQTTYLAQAADAKFAYQPGEMCGLDREAHEILLAPIHAPDGRVLVAGRRLPYDKLVIAVGSGANDFGTPGVNEHCFMIDSRRKADAFNQEIRLRMLRCMTSGEQLQVAIVGGGATGVELAAELVQLAESARAYGVLGAAAKFRIVLIEAGLRLLPSFPEEISEATRVRLQALGVSVVLGGRVSRATTEGFELANGELIPAGLRVWAAGVKAPEFLTQLGLQTTRSNQLLVNDEMQTSDPDIYALGDCASYTLPGHEVPLPPTAQVAHQQARYLIETLPHVLERPGGQVRGVCLQRLRCAGVARALRCLWFSGQVRPVQWWCDPGAVGHAQSHHAVPITPGTHLRLLARRSALAD